MAIELGALNLAIRDQGGASVLEKLSAIDSKGKALGAKPVTVPVRAPGAEETQAKLVGLKAAGDRARMPVTMPVAAPGATQAAAQVAGIGRAATASTAQVGMLGRALGSLRGMAGGAGTVAGVVGATALLGALGDTARAFDDVEKAQRKLVASSKLTGAALADIQKIAKDGEQNLRLSAGASADFTASVVKLTSRAEKLNKSGEFMVRWLDLAAANGLSATEAMQALETTIIGQDEGLNKLGLSNPQQIYEAWAKGARTTAAKMSDVEKAQAIVNEIITKGSRVKGDYVRMQETAAGKSAELSRQVEILKVSLGQMFVATRGGLLDSGAQFIGWLSTAITKFNELDAAGERWWANVAKRMGLAGGADTESPTFRRQGPPNPTATRTPVTITGERETEAEKQARKAAEEREAARVRELAALATLAALQKTTAADIQRAAQLERELTRELEQGNVSRVRRAELLQQLHDLRESGERAGVIGAQVAALKTLAELRKVDVAALQTASALQAELTAELQRGTASLVRQAEIRAQLNTLAATGLTLERQKTRSITPSVDLAPAKTLGINAKDAVELGLKGAKPDLTDFEQGIAQGITNAIMGGLTTGFAMGFAQGGIGEGFKQMGAQMLAGLADVFLRIGAKAIMGSALISSIATGLATLNPVVAIAAGTALLALAATMSARGGGGRVSTGGFSGFGSGAGSPLRLTLADQQIRRATLPVGARPGAARPVAAPTGPEITVIGADTAQGQRIIGTASARFHRRGGG